jgi:uncharacterized protein (UPF0548 family)
MNIRVEKVGGIWHGTIDGHPEIDERGLTEEIARRKVNDVASKLTSDSRAALPQLKSHQEGSVAPRDSAEREG